jgi:hypothetical protein
MKSNKSQNNSDKAVAQGEKPCKLVRRRLLGQPSERHAGLFASIMSGPEIDFATPWIHRHIASCPRCQRRFSAINRVNLALSLMKSRPHSRHLLSQANARTVGVLQHKLRETDKAQALSSLLPKQSIGDRIRLARHSLAHVAACIAVLLLSKIGIFSTIKHSQSAGQRAVRQLYASHLDDDTTDEVFPQV